MIRDKSYGTPVIEDEFHAGGPINLIDVPVLRLPAVWCMMLIARRANPAIPVVAVIVIEIVSPFE
jgi:hypothetical protein